MPARVPIPSNTNPMNATADAVPRIFGHAAVCALTVFGVANSLSNNAMR
jgi:hypothetical protein